MLDNFIFVLTLYIQILFQSAAFWHRRFANRWRLLTSCN